MVSTMTDSKPIVPPHVSRRLAAVAFADVAGFQRAHGTGRRRDHGALEGRSHRGHRAEDCGIPRPPHPDHRRRAVRRIPKRRRCGPVGHRRPVCAARVFRAQRGRSQAAHRHQRRGRHRRRGRPARRRREHRRAHPAAREPRRGRRDGGGTRVRVEQARRGSRDLGERELKNIGTPVRIYASTAETRSTWHSRAMPRTAAYLAWSNGRRSRCCRSATWAAPRARITSARASPRRSSAALSRSRSLYVIARQSTLRYRDRTRSEADRLRARRQATSSTAACGGRTQRLRISAELIDAGAATARIWARAVRWLQRRLFDFQDRIASSIVATIEPKSWKRRPRGPG